MPLSSALNGVPEEIPEEIPDRASDWSVLMSRVGVHSVGSRRFPLASLSPVLGQLPVVPDEFLTSRSPPLSRGGLDFESRALRRLSRPGGDR